MNDQCKYIAAFWSKTQIFLGWDCIESQGEWFRHRKIFDEYKSMAAELNEICSDSFFYLPSIEQFGATTLCEPKTKNPKPPKKNQPYYRQFEKRSGK